MVLIVATIITVVVMAIRTSHHDLAKDPNNIEKIVKVDLPDIAFVESENNLDRSASRWDIFEHRGKFICELTEETTTTLDNLCQTDSLHWRKAQDRTVYSYYDEGDESDVNSFVNIIMDGDYCRISSKNYDGTCT